MSSLKALASFVIATSLRRESIRVSGVSANALIVFQRVSV